MALVTLSEVGRVIRLIDSSEAVGTLDDAWPAQLRVLGLADSIVAGRCSI
jgi:hypothetical protein